MFINLFRLRIKDTLTSLFSNLGKHKALVIIIIPILENQNHYPKLSYLIKMEPDRLLGKACAK